MRRPIVTSLFIALVVGAAWYFLAGPTEENETPREETVKLYYYDPEKDKDASGNILCSAQGLVAVERDLTLTRPNLEKTIQLLLEGNLSADERARGITTEFPLSGLELVAASLDPGDILSLTFDDPQNKTVGSACRVSILWAQIEATAKQFAGVHDVRFLPDELFQP